MIKGSKHTPQTIKKLSISHKGQKAWNKGFGDYMKGDKHPMWKGGHSTSYRRKTATRPMPNQCEICGAFGSDFKKGLCFDHDHKTGKFRGWLCSRCNATLGLVKENVETLLAIIDYIKKNK